ncbi:hypothetical protein [Pseudomonas sp. HTZ2]|uniref:hypothetical protein n=1 Tax=Pseudomonas sp. HTZ2 TaxID=3075220 RepID=UPI002958BDA2|nr:hypothetical protein [Pseudomonas sp. HTZ2]
MIQSLISTAISAVISLSLLFGNTQLHRFAFYVTMAFNVLAWIGWASGAVTGEVVERLLRYWWISVPSTGFQLYALISSNHPGLAASVFLVSFLITAAAARAAGVLS